MAPSLTVYPPAGPTPLQRPSTASDNHRSTADVSLLHASAFPIPQHTNPPPPPPSPPTVVRWNNPSPTPAPSEAKNKKSIRKVVVES